MVHLPRVPRGRLSEVLALATLVVMSDAVDDLIRKFVTELRQLVREDIVKSLLAGEVGSTPRKTTVASKAPGKRSAETIAEQAKTILGWLKRNPGSSAQAIAEGIGVELKELALPLAKLKEDKALKVSGVRRGTKYSAK